MITRDNIENLLLGISRLQVRKLNGPWESVLRTGPTARSDLPEDFSIPCETSSGEVHPISGSDFDSEGRIIQGDDYTYRVKPPPERIPTGDIVITRDNIEELLNAGRIERRRGFFEWEQEWEPIHPNGLVKRFDADEIDPNGSFTLTVPYKTESGSTDILYGYNFDADGKLYQDEESYHLFRVVPAKPPPPPLSPSMRAIGSFDLECPYCERRFSTSDPISLWHSLTCAHAAGAGSGEKEPSAVPAPLWTMALSWLIILGLVSAGAALVIAALPMLLGAAVILWVGIVEGIASLNTLGWIFIVLAGILFVLIAIWNRLDQRR